MANPHTGEVSFVADGATYTLRYSSNALVELENQLDRGIVDISSEMVSWSKKPEKVRLGVIRAVLWAGLRDHHPEIDVRAAGEMISAIGGILAVSGLIGEAFQRAFPAPETKGARPPKRKQKSNGIGHAS